METLILNFCIKIRFLPNEIFGLPKLKEVYFYNTDINEIPKSIANSSIEVFTNDLKKMTKLFNVKAFSFRMLKCMDKKHPIGKFLFENGKMENNIKNVPEFLINQGMDAVKNYLKK